jgi:hypothetical protein
MSRTLIDPTGELAASTRERLVRPTTLDGTTVGLLDISKARGDVFLDQVQLRLEQRGLRVQRFVKPTFTKIAPIDLRHEISKQCDVVIEALAD